MKIKVIAPLDAKREFASRPYRHFGIGIAIFAPVCLGLMLIPNLNPLLAAVVAFALAFGVYFWLESQLVVIECPKCGGDINTNTPWECGFKGCRNENAHDFPFTRECPICHYIPKAYECHHCGNLVYLTSDRQDIYAAKLLKAPKPATLPPVDSVKIEADREAHELRRKKHQLAITEIDKKIEIVKNKPAAPLPPTPETQKMRERVRKRVESGRDLIKLERELLEEVRKECGDDMELFAEEEKNILMEIWRERERREHSPQQDG